MSERTAAFVARSGARSAVLRAVAAEGRPGEELVSTLDLSKSGVYKAINELAERDLIAQDGTAWTATALGRLVVDELDRHRRLDALLDHGEYWLTHDLSVLPDRFRRRMPELGAVDVMRNPDNDPRYLERYWTEQMPGYEQLWVGSRIFHWEYGEAMDEQARAEASTGKAIRSGEAGQPDGARDRTGHRGDETDERGRPEGATRLLSHAPLVEENPEGVAEYLERRPDAVRQRVCELPCSFMLTEELFTLSLPFPDGRYDQDAVLVGEDEAARQFGTDFFTYYWERATPMRSYLSDLDVL